MVNTLVIWGICPVQWSACCLPEVSSLNSDQNNENTVNNNRYKYNKTCLCSMGHIYKQYGCASHPGQRGVGIFWLQMLRLGCHSVMLLWQLVTVCIHSYCSWNAMAKITKIILLTLMQIRNPEQNIMLGRTETQYHPHNLFQILEILSVLKSCSYMCPTSATQSKSSLGDKWHCRQQSFVLMF